MAFSWLINGGDPNHIQVLDDPPSNMHDIHSGFLHESGMKEVLVVSRVQISAKHECRFPHGFTQITRSVCIIMNTLTKFIIRS